jgi:hypothetical protein
VAGSALSLACAGFGSRLVGLEMNRIGVCPLEQLIAGIKKITPTSGQRWRITDRRKLFLVVRRAILKPVSTISCC